MPPCPCPLQFPCKKATKYALICKQIRRFQLVVQYYGITYFSKKKTQKNSYNVAATNNTRPRSPTPKGGVPELWAAMSFQEWILDIESTFLVAISLYTALQGLGMLQYGHPSQLRPT